MGPDLTNVISSKGKGPQYAAAFIKNGTLKMPNFYLSDAEVDALVSFLEEVSHTGEFPLKNHDIAWTGALEMQ